jgi:hypothetical protein
LFEIGFDGFPVQGDLAVEFGLRKQKGQGMVVGFVEEFNAAGGGEILEDFQDRGLVAGELFERDS